MRVETADDSPCEVEPVGKLVFGKWTSHLLWAVAHDGPMSFSALRASAPRATPKVITARLRQLERDGLIARRRFREAPPRTEYQITPLGRSLIPVFRELVYWSELNFAQVSQARARYDADNIDILIS
jgi:DNA-binding HxlR family transcriptional regulator